MRAVGKLLGLVVLATISFLVGHAVATEHDAASLFSAATALDAASARMDQTASCNEALIQAQSLVKQQEQLMKGKGENP